MRESRKLKKLQRQMDQCTTYEEWRELAMNHDETSGQKRWREVDQSSQYDYSQIRLRLDRLRSLRSRHDYQGLLFTLNEGILRHLFLKLPKDRPEKEKPRRVEEKKDQEEIIPSASRIDNLTNEKLEQTLEEILK